MIIETLRELVQIPSLSGQERPILDYIKTNFEGLGLKPFFQDENFEKVYFEWAKS